MPLNITEEDIRNQFQKLLFFFFQGWLLIKNYKSFGDIEEVKIIKKNTNGQFLKDFYYAFVTMQDQKSVQDVLKNYMKTNMYLLFSKIS